MVRSVKVLFLDTGSYAVELKDLRDANIRRHEEWAGDTEISLAFRGLELGGEAGEVLNEIKKLERERMGIAGGKTELEGLKEELADVLICADLIAMDLGIDLSDAVEKKFNGTSEKFGLKTRFRKQEQTL